jgi:hypothetical protein
LPILFIHHSQHSPGGHHFTFVVAMMNVQQRETSRHPVAFQNSMSFHNKSTIGCSNISLLDALGEIQPTSRRLFLPIVKRSDTHVIGKNEKQVPIERKLSSQLKDMIRTLNHAEFRVREISASLEGELREEDGTTYSTVSTPRPVEILALPPSIEQVQAITSTQALVRGFLIRSKCQLLRASDKRIIQIQQETTVEISHLRQEFEQQKEQIRREMENQILHPKLAEQNNPKQTLIDLLRENNRPLQKKRENLLHAIGLFQADNDELMEEKEEISKYIDTLSKFASKMQQDYDALRDADTKCREYYQPLYREQLAAKNRLATCESLQKTTYRECVYKIATHTEEALSMQQDTQGLTEEVLDLIRECERELGIPPKEAFSDAFNTAVTYRYESETESYSDYELISDSDCEIDSPSDSDDDDDERRR